MNGGKQKNPSITIKKKEIGRKAQNNETDRTRENRLQLVPQLSPPNSQAASEKFCKIFQILHHIESLDIYIEY